MCGEGTRAPATRAASGRGGRGTAARLVRPAAVAAVAVLLLVVVGTAAGRLSWWTALGVLLPPVASLVLLRIASLVALALSATTILVLATVMSDGVPPWSLAPTGVAAAAALLAGRRAGSTVAAGVVLGAAAVLTGLLALLVSYGWTTGVVLLVVAVGFPWGLGRLLRQQTDLAAATVERVHLRERAHVARDLHDSIGHELNLLALRAGALELDDALDERHRDTAARLRAGVETAVERLADAVEVLRDGAAVPLEPAGADLAGLVERAAAAGMDVRLEQDGRRRLAPMAGQAVHRVVQESLTNAAKHAPGAPVVVRLTVTDDRVRVRVTNPLVPRARRGTGGRLGLLGLRERISAVGGVLRTGPRDGTFEVVATVPQRETT